MEWKFWKKPKPEPRDKREWNEDWQVGDIAECVVADDQWCSDVPLWMRLSKGSRYTVSGLHEGAGSYGDRPLIYALALDGVRDMYATTAFRKVRPIKAEESEIIQHILNAKPGKDNVRKTTNG